MQFKNWLLRETHDDDYLKTLVPHDLIGTGSFAHVYSTQDPDIVMRVEADLKRPNIRPQFIDQYCEKYMARPEIQETGGVAKIYKIEHRPINFNDEKKPIVITYKERVNPEWLHNWEKKYGKKVYDLLSWFRAGDKDKAIEKLKEFENTEGLQKAIALGLPLEDLAHHNLGINKKGQLVAIDC